MFETEHQASENEQHPPAFTNPNAWFTFL